MIRRDIVDFLQDKIYLCSTFAMGYCVTFFLKDFEIYALYQYNDNLHGYDTTYEKIISDYHVASQWTDLDHVYWFEVLLNLHNCLVAVTGESLVVI